MKLLKLMRFFPVALLIGGLSLIFNGLGNWIGSSAVLFIALSVVSVVLGIFWEQLDKIEQLLNREHRYRDVWEKLDTIEMLLGVNAKDYGTLRLRELNEKKLQAVRDRDLDLIDTIDNEIQRLKEIERLGNS